MALADIFTRPAPQAGPPTQPRHRPAFGQSPGHRRRGHGRPGRVGRRDRRADPARPHPLGRRLARRERRAAARDGRRGQAHQAQPRVAPGLLPRPLAPERCRSHRGAHLHRVRARRGRRSDEQLGRARRDPRDDHPAVRGQHARAHDVRRAVLDGPRRRPPLAHRRAGHRQRLRRHLDRHHDPRRHRRAARDRRRRAVGQDRPLGRRAARSRASRMSRGRATTRSTSCTSPTRSRSGRSAPATAATRSSRRSASRCASPR